jgi:hypothetical protein
VEGSCEYANEPSGFHQMLENSFVAGGFSIRAQLCGVCACVALNTLYTGLHVVEYRTSGGSSPPEGGGGLKREVITP